VWLVGLGVSSQSNKHEVAQHVGKIMLELKEKKQKKKKKAKAPL